MRAADRGKQYEVAVTVKITRAMAGRVEEWCEKEGLTPSAWIRAAVEEALVTKAMQHAPQPTHRMVLEAVEELRTIVVTMCRPEWVEKKYTPENFQQLLKEAILRVPDAVDGRIFKGSLVNGKTT